VSWKVIRTSKIAMSWIYVFFFNWKPRQDSALREGVHANI